MLTITNQDVSGNKKTIVNVIQKHASEYLG